MIAGLRDGFPASGRRLVNAIGTECGPTDRISAPPRVDETKPDKDEASFHAGQAQHSTLSLRASFQLVARLL